MPQITISASGPTKGSIVETAYDFCGLSSDQYERTPEEMAKGLRLLNSLMSWLKLGKGIDLSYIQPRYGEGLLEEPSGIPDGAREPIAALLAQRIAPTIGASLTDDAKAILSSAVADLYAYTAPAPIARKPAYRFVSAARRHSWWRCLCPTTTDTTTTTPAPTPTPTPTPSPAPTPPALNALAFSATAFVLGVPASGTISNATTGSTISATGLPSGLTINSIARTWSWSGAGTLGSGSFTLTETLPFNGTTVTRDTTFAYAVFGALTFSSTSFIQGTPVSGTINGAVPGSVITASGLPAGLTINSTARTFAWDGTGAVGSGSITLTETIGTNSNNSTVTYSITGTLRAPTLTETSTAGTNPPTWDSTFPDGQDGDTIELYYTEDGSTPVANGSPQGTHTFNGVEETINWGTAWPNPFPGSITVKWAERYGRMVRGVMVWSSLSNVLSDNMPSAGGVLTPISSTPAHQTNSATTHTFSAVTFGAGKPVVGVSAYFTNSVTLTPSGGGTPVTLTLVADVDASRRDATVWWSSTSISSGNYDIAVGHSAANSDCAVFAWTGTGITTAGSSFGQAAGVSSSDYAGTVPTLASGAVYAAIAHSYANSAMNWSGAATPTKDVEQQDGSTMSAAHGNTAGAIHCAPSPGAFGAMAGVVFNP